MTTRNNHVEVKGYKIIRSRRHVKDMKNCYGGLICIRCATPIQFMTSVPAKIITGRGAKECTEKINGVEYVLMRYFPITKKGRACKKCEPYVHILMEELND